MFSIIQVIGILAGLFFLIVFCLFFKYVFELYRYNKKYKSKGIVVDKFKSIKLLKFSGVGLLVCIFVLVSNQEIQRKKLIAAANDIDVLVILDERQLESSDAKKVLSALSKIFTNKLGGSHPEAEYELQICSDGKCVELIINSDSVSSNLWWVFTAKDHIHLGYIKDWVNEN